MSHLGCTLFDIWAMKTRPPLFTFCVLHGLWHAIKSKHLKYFLSMPTIHCVWSGDSTISPNVNVVYECTPENFHLQRSL